MLGQRIWGKRLGIIGMGRIGQAVARRALGFGLTIHYHNRKRVHAEIEEELDATWWESLDQMLAHMDLITIHCPSTPATFHLLSARRLKLIRPTSYIVKEVSPAPVSMCTKTNRQSTRNSSNSTMSFCCRT